MLSYPPYVDNQSVWMTITQGPSNSNPGAPASGVVAADIASAYYHRTYHGMAFATEIPTAFHPLSDAAHTAAHADGNIAPKTNCPGEYRLDLPDAAFEKVGILEVTLNFVDGDMFRARPLARQVSPIRLTELAMGFGRVVAGTLTPTLFSFEWMDANTWNTDDRMVGAECIFFGRPAEHARVLQRSRINDYQAGGSPVLLGVEGLQTTPVAGDLFCII